MHQEQPKSISDDLKNIFEEFHVGDLFHHFSPTLNPNDDRFNDILWEKEWYLVS